MKQWWIWWLTAEKGEAAIKKDGLLLLLGLALMIGYRHWLGGPWWAGLLLLGLPAMIKMVVAVCVVGWRKAIIPQNGAAVAMKR